ncbi:MAG TPA: thioesterase family protein [Longimicrobiales bacterium]|nr:thioesterase family protein [Longimicrobiales bacterium]
MPAAHSVSEIRVRYGETDQMGVAYHANYLVWCEIGRTDLIRTLGPSYADMERDGLRLAVAEASVRYRAPARYDDVVQVETRLDKAQSRFVTFSYRIVLDRPAAAGTPGTLLATASTVLVALDDAGRTRVMPAHVRELFQGFVHDRT